MDSSPYGLITELGIIFLLLGINAFFAASEMAIVSLNKAKLNALVNEENEKAILVQQLIKEPSKLFASIQVGITVAGFLASAFAATGISEYLAVVLDKINIPASDEISVVLVTIILSYMTLAFAELFPKRLALHNAEKIALFSVKTIVFISKISAPFVKMLTGTTNVLLRLVGIDHTNMEEKVSEEEIKMMIDVGEENGVINETEKEMIHGIFEFDDTLAKEIMTPRTDVFAIEINDFNETTTDVIFSEKFSRIPVYEDDIDNIIGVLYIKDLWPLIKTNSINKDSIRKLLREPYFVPETKNIDTLFKELQSSKKYLAVLIDEYGGFSGIVTIEDLIEEVMGNIFDESDDRIENIKKIDNYTYLVNGLASIDEVNETTELNLPDENCDTISGLIISLLGAIPRRYEQKSIRYENATFEILSVNYKRIEKLQITIDRKKEED